MVKNKLLDNAVTLIKIWILLTFKTSVLLSRYDLSILILFLLYHYKSRKYRRR